MKINLKEVDPFTVEDAVLRRIPSRDSEEGPHSRIDLVLVNGVKKFTKKITFTCRYYDDDGTFCGVDTPWCHLDRSIDPSESVDIILNVTPPKNASRVDIRLHTKTNLMNLEMTDLPVIVYFVALITFGVGFIIGKFFK